MQRLVGPILHLKQGDPQTWRFTVSVWARRERRASSAKQLTLTFDPTSQATADPTPRDAGGFHDGRWLIWNVSIPRRATELETSYRLEGFTDGAVEADRVVVPAVDQAPRLAFFSCNGVQHPEDWTTQPEMERLWNRMHRRHNAPANPDGSAGPYHVLVGGGDQLYCDEIWHDVLELRALNTWAKRQQARVRPALRRGIEAMYASFYARWRVSWSADLLARVPGIYIWDDHEIFDGWGSYEENLQQCEVFEAIFAVAQKAFMLFQLGGDLRPGRSLCLDPQGGHFLQAVHFPAQLDVLVLDLRSQRTQRQVMGETQWGALKKYLQNREAAGGTAPHLLVVSSVPVVYLNFTAAEKFLDWLPWRQGLEDDLRDQWESPAHQEERARLIMTLFDHAKAAQTRVTILSGDVHVGARGRITSRRPEHLLGQETEKVMHQLTSSAIVYPPPRALTLAGMRVTAKEGPVELSAISHVETEVVALGARHFLLGQNNWLSIEPDLTWPSSRKQLWVRWVTEGGDVPPHSSSVPASERGRPRNAPAGRESRQEYRSPDKILRDRRHRLVVQWGSFREVHPSLGLAAVMFGRKQAMKLGNTKFEAGPITFALQYRALMPDQGVSLQVASCAEGEEKELLRFDCFDQNPHYHYDPGDKNLRYDMDKTTAGNPVGWTLQQLRTRLPEMLKKAGFEDIANKLDCGMVLSKLDQVEEAARYMAVKQRRTVTHNRGDVVVEAGNIRFGLEFRELTGDRGMAIHVLSDVAGQEIELLAFDCFEGGPHYHYGPRNQDVRIYWDTTVVPDTLEWTLKQFKSGKLPAMIERAGYPTIAAALDRDLVLEKVTKEVEPKAMAMRAAHAK